MKYLLSALLVLALSTASAFASSCNVTEYRLYAPSGVQIADLDSLVADQAPVTTSGTSAQSASLSADTGIVQLFCDTQSAFAYGSNPTATTSNQVIGAGATIYYKVTGSAGRKIAFILRP
jgi:hypothetical protein